MQAQLHVVVVLSYEQRLPPAALVFPDSDEVRDVRAAFDPVVLLDDPLDVRQ